MSDKVIKYFLLYPVWSFDSNIKYKCLPLEWVPWHFPQGGLYLSLCAHDTNDKQEEDSHMPPQTQLQVVPEAHWDVLGLGVSWYMVHIRSVVLQQ